MTSSKSRPSGYAARYFRAVSQNPSGRHQQRDCITQRHDQPLSAEQPTIHHAGNVVVEGDLAVLVKIRIEILEHARAHRFVNVLYRDIVQKQKIGAASRRNFSPNSRIVLALTEDLIINLYVRVLLLENPDRRIKHGFEIFPV